jgi:protoheme IX farnesyltransferase
VATKSLALEQQTMHDDVRDSKVTWRDYLSLMKVGITVANLMATFAGFWVACHGNPDPGLLVWTLLGTALVVASGATLNNYVDRDIDHRMERTRHRAVASGKVPPSHALAMGLALGAAGFAILSLLVNWVAAVCALVGWVMYAYIYTVWLKRTTSLSTVLGGIAGAMPPLVGYAGANGGMLDTCAWALFFTFFLWQPPHFLPLAMRRCDDYRAAGIPMLPVVRGFAATKRQILLYAAAMWPVSLLPYALGYENLAYLVVMFLLGLGFVVEAVRGMNTEDDIHWANRLFRYSLVYLTGLCAFMVIGTIGM